jgi:hypothetical protein
LALITSIKVVSRRLPRMSLFTITAEGLSGDSEVADTQKWQSFGRLRSGRHSKVLP